MNKEIEILKRKNRIQLLEQRPYDNSKIIKKLKREIKKFQS